VFVFPNIKQPFLAFIVAGTASAHVSIKHGLSEIEICYSVVVLIFLIDNKKYDEEWLGFPSDLIFMRELANFLSNRLKLMPM
jgi:hypothetical protein